MKIITCQNLEKIKSKITYNYFSYIRLTIIINFLFKTAFLKLILLTNLLLILYTVTIQSIDVLLFVKNTQKKLNLLFQTIANKL